MVQNVNKLKGKITENGYNLKNLSKAMDLCELTLRRKINNSNSEFTLSESLKIKKILNISNQDYLEIFFGTELEFNS
jgi:hypothetical protein